MSPRFCDTEIPGEAVWWSSQVRVEGGTQGTQGNRSGTGKSDNCGWKEGLEIVMAGGRMRLGKVLLV